MRSVSSAIWTLVLPVSCSLEPNLAAISRLRSVVSGHGGATVADGRRLSVQTRRRRSRACLLDVAVHLLDQRLGVVEAPLAAQARRNSRRSSLP